MLERTHISDFLIGNNAVQLHTTIWEPENSTKAVFCVHGFADTGRDFEILARTLTKAGFTVIAPDMLGRGQSSFLGDSNLYKLRTYIKCLEVLQKFSKARNFHIGSSWGGAITLAYLASQGWRSNGIILNDIPIEANDALTFFRKFLGQEAGHVFKTRAEIEDHILRTRSLGFLNPSDKDKIVGARILKVRNGWSMRYDPATTQAFGSRSPFSLDRILRDIHIPTLLTFGNQSPYADEDLLASIAAENPNVTYLTDLDDPHPPSLMKMGQVLQIAGYLGALG